MERGTAWPGAEEARAEGSARVPDSELGGYVRRLEGMFLQLRGRGVQWSPEDAARAGAWYRAGLPLTTVVGAIEGRVKAFRFVNGDDAALPRHLAWYEPTVTRRRGHGRIPVAQPAPLSAAGPGAMEADPAPLEGLLVLVDALPELVAGAEDPALAEAYGRAQRSLRRLTGAGASGASAPPQLDEATLSAAVSRCRTNMVRTLMTGIGPGAAAELQARVAAKMAAEGAGSASAKAQRARAQVLLERSLGAEYGLHLPTMAGWRNPAGAGERRTPAATGGEALG